MNGDKEQQVPQQLSGPAHTRPSRILSLIHSPSRLQAIRQSHILVVGAGGIGCEVIKNLSRSGVTHLSLIDYDRIEETNLNRQFYFRPSHIGLPKTEILKQVMVQFGMHISAYNVDLFEQQLPPSFWNSVTLIISALDSMKARQELSRLAMKFDKALVDAGTLGFNGQVTSTVRFRSSCHNCQQEQPEESYAACTIRNSPTLNRHVGVYAKNFFEAYFSDESLFLSELNYKQSSSPKRIFSALFSGLVSPVRSLCYDDVVAHPQLYVIPTTKSIYEEDSLHDIPYYCRNFALTLSALTQERRERQFSLEKDNHTMVLLLTCIFNLRVYNYQPTSPQLKYLTYYQCKDLITKVYFAIASANSIAAGLQATQSYKLINAAAQSYKLINAARQHANTHGALANTHGTLANTHGTLANTHGTLANTHGTLANTHGTLANTHGTLANTHEVLTQNSLYISFVNFSEERLQPSYLPEPNPECLFCSKRVIYGQVQANLEERTFEQLDEFLSNRFYTYHRKMYHKEAILWHPAQKGRRLNHFSHLVKNGQIDLECRPIQCMTPLKVNVLLIHSKTEGFTVREQYNPTKKQISQQLIRYLEEREKDDMFRLAEEVKRYGVC